VENFLISALATTFEGEENKGGSPFAVPVFRQPPRRKHELRVEGVGAAINSTIWKSLA
jgi:hypothetical protein